MSYRFVNPKFRPFAFITLTTLRLAFLLIVLLSAVMTSHSVLAAPTGQSDAQDGQQQTILVRFEAGSTPEMREALVAQMGGELVTWMHQIDVAEIRLPVESMADASISSLSLPSMASEMVTFAEVDWVVSGMDVPNDPDFSDAAMRYGFDHVQAQDAWTITTGAQEIIIAVVDSGVKLDHPEFAGRLVGGYDFINGDDQPDDDQGHGTHVAGVIAAGLNNGQGVAGICPNCRIMPVKVLDENNIGSWSSLAQGILFAVDQGARVINLSLGANVPSETLASAVAYAMENGVVVVAAAGNYGSSAPYYPAALEGVIAVGATNQAGTRWAKSNFGSYVDLTAPGYMIYSTYYDLNNLYHGYTYMSGTSMAAPFVSGVAGLLLSLDSGLRAEQVTEAMIVGAVDLGPEGWDAEYGHGRVNALSALLSPALELATEIDTGSAPADPLPANQPAREVKVFLPALGNN
ncbi:MAG: S8 family serine peptidase [Caldilineaceae bacterium]|nr:S8 family serine peptidase [Caldilineaceae bacterium]